MHILTTDQRPTDDRPFISKNSNGHISATDHLMFASRVGFSGMADLMTRFPFEQIQDRGGRHLGKISNGHISATRRPIHFICLCLGWFFHGRRIEWRYFRFEQIHDGGRRHLGEISHGHIYATGRSIHFLFRFKIYTFML